jgi:hypothetical protein
VNTKQSSGTVRTVPDRTVPNNSEHFRCTLAGPPQNCRPKPLRQHSVISTPCRLLKNYNVVAFGWRESDDPEAVISHLPPKRSPYIWRDWRPAATGVVRHNGPALVLTRNSDRGNLWPN